MTGQALIWQQRTGKDWPSDVRLVVAYFLSGPVSNRIGCFSLEISAIAEHTAIPPERMLEILALLEHDGFAYHDQGWVWIPDVLNQQPFADSEEVRHALPELAAV